jgi:hypothetical protein
MKPGNSLKFRQLEREDLTEAADVVGRAMRDNPSLARVFTIQGEDRRCRAITCFFVRAYGADSLNEE